MADRLAPFLDRLARMSVDVAALPWLSSLAALVSAVISGLAPVDRSARR